MHSTLAIISLFSLSLLMPGVFGQHYGDFEPDAPYVSTSCTRRYRNPVPTDKICGSRGTLQNPQLLYNYTLLGVGAGVLLEACLNSCSGSGGSCGSFSTNPTIGLCKLFRQNLSTGFKKKNASSGPKFFDNSCFVNDCGVYTTYTLTGTQEQVDDDSWEVTLPFNLRFGGTSNNKVWVSTNGFVSFGGSKPAGAYSNAPLPSTSIPNNTIAVFWDDLILNRRATGQSKALYRQQVSYSIFGRAVVFTWKLENRGVSNTDGTNGHIAAHLTMSENSNEAYINYDDMDGSRGSSATIGYQALNVDQFEYSQYSYNTANRVGAGTSLYLDFFNTDMYEDADFEPAIYNLW